MDWNATLADLKRHEGFRQFPYKDSVGILTIGYGRNLESKGISESEAEWLLKQDVALALLQLQRAVGSFDSLSDVRKSVLVNMTFNMGIAGVMKFKQMLAALEIKDYNKAADAMLDSTWAKQVGKRATELAEKMKAGV